jgi:hypothetical protein
VRWMSWSAGCGVGAGGDERNQAQSHRPKSQGLGSCRSLSHCIARIGLKEEAGGLVKAAEMPCVRLNEGTSTVMYAVTLKERSAHQGWCVLT